MNKQTFLNELRKQLHVLEEAEVNDIIDEYSQHIDIKIEKGQTEEEAIKDFGSVKELSEQILLAYHVRADRQRKISGIFHTAAETAGQEGKKAAESVSGYAKNVGEKMPGFFERIKAKVKNIASRIVAFIKRQYEKVINLFRRTNEKITMRREEGKQNNPGGTSIFSSLMNIIKKAAAFCLTAFIFLCIIGWDAFVLFIAVMGVIVLLLSIFGLGAAIVFLAEGYPLIGVVLGLIGITLCSGAFVAFILSLFVRRGRREKQILIESGSEPVKE
ncbi:MAG: DUF1700 domain-containing protein [Eubacteriales bacterium]|nr:DUF1700 domain-containing protein [Eubacteriales bacterium]